jgi:hypothetical protein
LIEIVIPASVEEIGAKCFAECRSLISVTFESGSRLSRIAEEAFSETGLIEIVIPASVEEIRAKCFAECGSLSSMTFEGRSRLRKVDGTAFSGMPVIPILPTKQ